MIKSKFIGCVFYVRYFLNVLFILVYLFFVIVFGGWYVFIFVLYVRTWRVEEVINYSCFGG